MASPTLVPALRLNQVVLESSMHGTASMRLVHVYVQNVVLALGKII